uniref:Obscurin-like protein 1 n=1 Tax=Oryzias latipes TaxID=8090 RepID=A0A3B3HGF2_ORYLA
MDVFGGAPRFLAYPRPVIVQSGTDAVLKCQIGGDPRPAVIWERNNEKIDPQGRYRVFEDGNVYNLIISAVTIEDSGQYICKAKNCIGETYAAATLKVEGEAQEMELREENKPRFLIKPLSTRVGRGEDAVFSCKLWGNPKPEIVWEKDGRKLNDIFETTHFNVGCQDGGWFQLKIFKTRAPDGGVYTCKARNEFGEALAGAVLLVDAGPGHEEEGNRNDETITKSTKVKMFAVTEGKHAKFRCFVTGKPKPEIIWRKDGRLILSGRRYLLYEDREGYFTLKVLYCKQKDNGVYVCAASNTAGQTLSAVHLSVKEPPVRFKQPLIDLEVWERDLAVLECEVPEDSVPITWYLEDRRLQPGAKYGMEEWGTKRRLTIRDIGIDDDGIYLCEMPDGGRSIAEVAVKGTIMRKLPRKVDVLEGENAAFCVEVEKEEMDIHWYKDGIELRETHQTILKSFGRTHILVFVNTMPEDSGLVTFLVGRSKTSSQLRVKECILTVHQKVLETKRANAALLSWVPAPDSRKNPPSGYVLERQEVGTGSQEWVQCLTTDSATSVEILGDSVPCEADYRFRICSVNKYGKSNNVEFPKTVHLVPVARIQAPLQDALVPEGQDAAFSIELSASVIGTWFLNGTQLQEDERYSMRRSRTHQSLRIRGVRDTDNGAEITFIAYGIRDSAALYIQGTYSPLVKFSPLSEMDRNKFVEVGNPIVLYCELSDPTAPVHWYKNGVELQTIEGLHIQSEGTMRRIVIQSAEFSHSGVYCCDDDDVHFTVEVKAPPVTFADIQEKDLFQSVVEQEQLTLSCEVSRADGVVHWYKDGAEIQTSNNVTLQAESIKRSLTINSARISDTGTYTCRAGDSILSFKVNVREPPVMIVYPKEDVHLDRHVPEEIILSCELSRVNGVASWFKDGQKLQESENIKLKVEGPYRRLKILSSRVEDSGEYVCDANDDSIFFHLSITEPPVQILSPSQSQMELCQQTSERMVLSCEISRPNAVVRWYRDGLEVEENENLLLEVDGVYRRLIIPETTVKDSAEYVCDTGDDSMTYFVNIAEPPVRFIRPRKTASKVEKMRGETLILDCEVSRSNAKVTWKKNGEEVEDSRNITIFDDGVLRQLTIHSLTMEDAGEYTCDVVDDNMTFYITVKEPPVQIIGNSGIPEHHILVTGDDLVLECEVSRPNAIVNWLQNGKVLTASDRVKIDSHKYSTSFKTQREHISRPSSPPFSSPLWSAQGNASFVASMSTAVTKVRRSATMCAFVSKEQAKVRWLKDGQLLNENNIHISSEGNTHKLTINPLRLSDSGDYVCDINTDEMSFNVVFLKAGSLTLQCEVNKPKADVQWLKDGKEISPSRKYTIRAQGRERSLSIQQLLEEDAGEYSCESTDDKTSATVTVLFSKKMTPVVAEEYSEATLEVELNLDSGEVQWVRQGVLIHPCAKYSLKNKGQKRSLTIHKLAVSDRGTYSCESLHDRTQAQLTVQRECARPLTMETASFEVELSHPNVPGTWVRNGIQLKPTNHFRMSAKGQVHSLTIYNLSVEDTGTFVFCVENLKTSARLVVKEPPVTIFRKLQSQKFPDGSVVSIECELSRHNIDVKWIKDGVEVKPNKDLRIYAMGRKRFLQIMRCHVTDSGLYTCDAGDASTSCTVERELVVLQGLEDLDIQEDQNAVFVCEVSVEDVPGEWFKNGEQINPTSTIKIRQEGTKHFLLMCNVRAEDSGEIMFVARNAESVAHLKVKELPVSIVKPLQDKTVLEKSRVVLDCAVSNPRCSIRWYKGSNVILPSEHFEISSEGCYRKLIIQQVVLDDEGQYSVQVGEYTCSATLTVEGKNLFYSVGLYGTFSTLPLFVIYFKLIRK